MDGDVGLSIDTKIEDIKCLGLGVYAFWEIVKVEKWWEYKVSSTLVYERTRPAKKEKCGRVLENTIPSAMAHEKIELIEPRSFFQNTSAKPHSMVKKEESGSLFKKTVTSTLTAYEDMRAIKFKNKTSPRLSERKEEKPWSWETSVPLIIENTPGSRRKQTPKELSKNTSSMIPSYKSKAEKSKERSEATTTETASYVIIAGQKRKRRRMMKEETLKRELAQEDRAQIIKRRRMEPDLETTANNTIKQTRTELDKKLDLMKSKNKTSPAIDLLKPFAETTTLDLKRHDDYVAKRRKNVEANSHGLGKLELKNILQRFEISWERQRQDIINRDPQFKQRVKSEPQMSTEITTSMDQCHGSLESIFKEREVHLDLEAIQRQLDIAKREHPQSKFTLRYSRDTVHLECAHCPDMNIRMGLKDFRDVAGIVKRHQASKYHMDNRYNEAQRKNGAQKSKNNI